MAGDGEGCEQPTFTTRLRRHLRRLYWTVSGAVGLHYLHGKERELWLRIFADPPWIIRLARVLLPPIERMTATQVIPVQWYNIEAVGHRVLTSASKRIIPIDDVPSLTFSAETFKYALRRAWWREGIRCEMPRAPIEDRQRETSAMRADLHREIFDLEGPPHRRRFLRYFDVPYGQEWRAVVPQLHHVTIEGSRLLGRQLLFEACRCTP